MNQKRKPKLKDIELIAMDLTTEYIDIECQLFRGLPSCLKTKIDRSVYNRRKRKLFFAIGFIGNELSNKFNGFENYSVVDSMPLGAVKLPGANRSKICKEEFYNSPNRGFCAS